MLWLVTPVYGRVALTRLVFEQRARMLMELRARGVECGQVVVGNDENLLTARRLGFATLDRPNPVGFRVNEGMEWAVREGGATHVAYCGSDDWHHPDYFADLPAPGFAKTSPWQAFVPPTGDRLVVMRSQHPAGGAPWVISRELIEPAGYRPAADKAPTAVDGSIADSIWAPIDVLHRRSGNHERRLAKKRVFQHDDSDVLRMVDFKAGGEQITPFEAVVGMKRTREVDTRSPWELLATRYPVDLVERMERFYATKEGG